MKKTLTILLLVMGCAVNPHASAQNREAQHLIYQDVLRMGKSFSILSQSESTRFLLEDVILGGRICNSDDSLFCFYTDIAGLRFSVPKQNLNLESDWRRAGFRYNVVGTRRVEWEGEVQSFYLIEGAAESAERKGKNLYLYSKEFGLIMIYLNAAIEGCAYCISAKSAYLLTKGPKGFGAYK